MRLFGWFRRPPDSTAAPQGSPARRWTWLSGRRILSNTPYVFPKDHAEGDRLDLQHHLLKIAAGGNYRAPIRQPATILDVACGTGIWGRELALEFKQAQVTGFDIDRTPLDAALARLGPTGQFPANFHFLEADALQPFPFTDGQFDFTHARLIGQFVPIARWPTLVAEMVRVTKRGGYVELADAESLTSPSQAFMFLVQASQHLLAMRGLHAGAGGHLAGYLRQAGLTRVQERRIALGAMRGLEREQRLLVTDLLAAYVHLQPIIVKAGILSDGEYSRALAQAKEELPRVGASMPIIFAFSLRL